MATTQDADHDFQIQTSAVLIPGYEFARLQLPSGCRADHSAPPSVVQPPPLSNGHADDCLALPPVILPYLATLFHVSTLGR